MIDAQVDNMLRETAQRMQSQGLSMDLYMKYTGMTADQMKDQMRPEAVKRIQTRLVLEAVVKAENIETSEEKLDEEIAKMAEAYKMEADKLKSYMTDSDKDQMKQDLAVQAAVVCSVRIAEAVLHQLNARLPAGNGNITSALLITPKADVIALRHI